MKLLPKKIDFNRFNIIMTEVLIVTNTLRVGKATERRNLVPKRKPCAHKIHSVTKSLINA